MIRGHETALLPECIACVYAAGTLRKYYLFLFYGLNAALFFINIVLFIFVSIVFSI